ncbi:cation:proton antiporter [Limisalsivibrio acetivorans]|uniref:cation:proton antiporter n=1 Tax=Limisalsivibrio acetivorans TaxID=1304888 RepID=UPI0003B5E117|nr:cation:proton antiporter [Limisalsivibrio acetivorans]
MHTNEAVLLMLISAGAFLMPIIGRRFDFLPSSVAEILYGIVIGTFIGSGLETGIVTFLSDFGFILLMYLAGMEIDVDEIAETGKRNLGVYFLYFIAVAVLAVAAASVTGREPSYSLIYLATAIGLLFPILKEMNLMGTPTGSMLLIMGSIGEVVTLSGLMVSTALFEYGFSVDGGLYLAQVAGFGLIAFIIIKLFTLYMWWFPATQRFFLSTGTVTETGVRGALVNMLIFTALAAIFHIKLIIGAFLGGFIFAAVFRQRHEIQERLGTFGYGFLVPVFFIDVGMNFDIGVLKDVSVLLAALEITAVVLLLRIVATPLLLLSNLRPAHLPMIPFATAFPLTLLVAVGRIGSELGWYTPKDTGAIVLAAIVTALIYPPVFKNLAARIRV